MTEPGSVIGWKLDRELREELLRRFPPRYPDTMADHVTLRTNAANEPLPGPVEAAIIGRADDDDSLECMVATIDGGSIAPMARPSTSPGRWTNRRDARPAAMTCCVEGGWTRWPETIPLQSNQRDGRESATIPRLRWGAGRLRRRRDRRVRHVAAGVRGEAWQAEFWRRIARARDFYARLPLMADAKLLFDAVAHLDPIILTGLPIGNWAAPRCVGRRSISRAPTSSPAWRG
jgi:hypothetical protein